MNNLEIINNDEQIIQSNKDIKRSDNNKITTDHETIPILEEIEINYLSVEQYYRTNYPEYKIIKCGNLIFIRMGRLLTFYFNKSNNFTPKFSIGPHWYLTIVLFILIYFLSALLYKTIFNKIGYIKQLIYFFFVVSIYIFVICTSLIHPNIIMNKKKNSQEYGFCSICKVYYNPYEKVEHCHMCGVCMPKMDHHCVWMGKCVANKNVMFFYGTLVDVGIFYLYIIFCAVLYAIGSKPKSK